MTMSWEEANREAELAMAEAHGRFPHARYRHQCHQGPSVGDSRNFWLRAAKEKGMILVGAAKRGWHEVVVYEADKYWPDYHRAYVFNWSVHSHHKNHGRPSHLGRQRRVGDRRGDVELGPGRGSRHVPPLRRSRLRTAATGRAG